MRAFIVILLMLLAGSARSQSFDPLGGAPAPSAAQPPIPSAPKSGAAYDPYGRWRPPTTIERKHETTRLLGVEDGTPLYELAPTTNFAPPSVTSRLLPIIRGSDLALGAGPDSPKFPGSDLSFELQYLADFWKTWPQAKVRGEAGGPETAPGDVPASIPASSVSNAGVPAEATGPLLRQANALYAQLVRLPVIQRSQGIALVPSVRLRVTRDPAGVEVYGFEMRIEAYGLATPPSRTAEGRWRGDRGAWRAGLRICSNCMVDYGPAWGRYEGRQVVFLNPLSALVTATNRPLHVSEFRGGGGEKIPNPELFDPTRPKTDIQVLTVKPVVKSPYEGRWAGQGSLNPDSAYGRLIAATFLTDWRAPIDAVNSPGAPRAQ